MQQVTHKNKNYIECSMAEVDAVRLDIAIQHKVKHGEGKQQVSPLMGCRSTHFRRKVTKELFDTNFTDNH